ncbi:hypothetical protein [Frigoribacterium sp. VKM Ac-2836]|uniref:hypothetical protein n=1 Tax=Frigoribacterium sp. VKM Ac-2836 TaxID=2739014 RepID=UPI001563CB49|nr:hypothetical protein [Frigoribacterium sp. VKM Ac-2836]NRD27103.1 hypothetical protein [Frigoribacterium sp. VKM Ac-2836]
MITYQQLAHALPKGDHLPQMSKEEPAGRAVDGEFFVEPNFDLVGDLAARVWLVSAPAAVGKTFIAQHLARDSSSPLWDLSLFSLGSHFFSGTMTEEHGVEGYLSFVNAFKATDGCLILDAMDEALVRSGAESMEAAVDNLVTILGSAQSGPSVVIFGRDDTIADVARVLGKSNVSTARMSVRFFTEQQSRVYVHEKSEDKVAALKAKLDEFLTKFFERVKSELGSYEWGDVHSFLGYAPVLEALSTAYDKKSNPLKDLNEALEDETDRQVWELLGRIVRSILLRETRKFSTSFGSGDDNKTRFAALTYSPETQLEMLMQPDLTAYVLDFPDEGDEDWLTDLDQQIRDQFREHPFLKSSRSASPNMLTSFSNPIFRDFVCAWAILERRVDEFDLLPLWGAPSISPAPLLTRFVFADSKRTHLIEASALPILADSHSSNFVPGKSILLIREDAPELHVDDSSAVMGVSLNEGGVTSSVLEVVPPVGDLEFLRALSSVEIEAPHANLRLGMGQRDFLLGPDVRLNVLSVESLVPDVRILHSQATTVKIHAESVTGITKRVIVHDLSSFVLVSDSAYHPWRQYSSEASLVGLEAERRMDVAGMELRRLVAWFSRPSMLGGGLRYPATALEQIFNKGRASRDMFDYLAMKKMAWLDGPEFVIKLDVPVEVVRLNDLSNELYAELIQGYVLAHER